MHAVEAELPYTGATVTVRQLANARWLISEELRHHGQVALAAAVAKSAVEQENIAEEMKAFLQASSKLSSTDPLALSPISGACSPQLNRPTARSGDMFFPQMPAPQQPFICKEQTPIDEEAELLSSARTSPFTVSSQSTDALYYETLLAQCINGKLFLEHGDYSVAGDNYLHRMQHIQEQLYASELELANTNAQRKIEQTEFTRDQAAMHEKIRKTAAKVRALEEAVGVKRSRSQETHESLLERLER